MSYEKIAFISSDTDQAREAKAQLVKRYGQADVNDADVIVALGGDGLMLQALHDFMKSGIPIYGINCGSVGFLMNEFETDNLTNRLASAELTTIHPLRMNATDVNGDAHQSLAINEVSLFRQTHQAAKLTVFIDERERLDELVCDGVLVATPAGSTAYNLSVHGPILPINSSLLALTPISAFRPRRWRGALLPHEARVLIEVQDSGKRPVSAVADHAEFRNIARVEIAEDESINISILFDEGHNLDERVLREQFRY